MHVPPPPRRDDGSRDPITGAPIGGETPDDYAPLFRFPGTGRTAAPAEDPPTPNRPPLSESPNPRLRAMTTRARVRRLAKLIDELRHEEVPEHAIELVTGYHARLEVQAAELEEEADRRLAAERSAELERQAVTFVEDGIPPTEAELAAAERVDAWDDLGGRP